MRQYQEIHRVTQSEVFQSSSPHEAIRYRARSMVLPAVYLPPSECWGDDILRPIMVQSSWSRAGYGIRREA